MNFNIDNIETWLKNHELHEIIVPKDIFDALMECKQFKITINGASINGCRIVCDPFATDTIILHGPENGSIDLDELTSILKDLN